MIDTIADLIAELQKHDQAAVPLVQDNLHYRRMAVVKLASTEYGIEPGRKKVAIVTDRQSQCM